MTLNSVIIGLFIGFAYGYLFSGAAHQKQKKHRNIPLLSKTAVIINATIMNGFLLRYLILGVFLYSAVSYYGLDIALWCCGFFPAFWASILMNTKVDDENFRI